MATVDKIKNYILAHLNLKQETTLLETLWFEIAHKELQRRHNFRCMEVYANINLVSGNPIYSTETQVYTGSYQAVPSAASLISVKEWGWYGYSYNHTTGTTIGAYQQKSMRDTDEVFYSVEPSIHATVANLTVDGFFSIMNNELNLYPIPPASLNGMLWYCTSWRWLDAPIGTEEDWFCKHATDYLIYRSLLESGTFIDHPGARVEAWSRAAEIAFQQLLALDSQSKWAGPLRARG